ncbi:GNAT family N-acetyltransferase, partial [Escherichia coli]|nr:GNAT family N-acetyltransferase [Escherichia coli]EER2858447.1 GNAT family N-acetyltransferase [Escherichia coli]EER7820976.1 GNAT family N-acetyltransferase [Escherichia coli]EER9162298.1 GNAT family N-acetyltransferase [Escherichia coli]EER9552362.1 GNAT family N-acetyltransferase [Escherichia coli]
MRNLSLFTKNTKLIPVEINDAEFIYSLRIDSRLNKHISTINGTVIEQAEWIEDYKKREENNEEFYFIIKRTDNDEKIGTIRLYNITKDDGFCWGSWILNDDKMKSSAIESAYLIYKF